MKSKKAVVLGVGGSLKEYNQEDFKDAYVIGVNDAYQVHEQVHGKPPKMDMLIVQDSHHRAKQAKPHIFDTPKDVLMRFINPTWQGFANKRGNADIVKSQPHKMNEELVDSGAIVHGNTSVIGALFEAMRRGYTELYLFGHDCSPGHMLNNRNALERTYRELNFIGRLIKKKGGYLKLASTSWLWNYKHPSPALAPWSVEKYEATEEKPKRTRRKKKTEDSI